MASITGFPPVYNPNATTLILGSMPGNASLAASQYYAHPRNAFWTMIEAIYGINQTLSYDARITALQKTDLALWDVLQYCKRQGSLDSAIEADSMQANHFVPFFNNHPRINRVVFNGKAAEHTFRRHVLKQLNMTKLNLVCAPSTSPAHTIPIADKITAWRIALKD